ncbi:hypothetical protein D3C71_1948200 [compost metagenome]
MSTMQLDSVEANPLGIRRSLGKRSNNRVDILLCHRLCHLLTGQVQPGRANRQRLNVRELPNRAGHADMPELRNDFAAGGMNFRHHISPALQ